MLIGYFIANRVKKITDVKQINKQKGIFFHGFFVTPVLFEYFLSFGAAVPIMI